MTDQPSPVICDLCAALDAAPITVGTRFGRSAPIVQCRRCGLTYQSPRLGAAELDGFYRDEYRSLYSGSSEPSPWFLDDQRQRGERILRRVRDAGIETPLRVLDVGCGAGGTLLPFREAGCATVGIEPGPFGLWAARSLGLDIRQTDLTGLRDEPQFGLVMLSFVLEHVPSPFETLAALRDLVVDGHIYVEVPNLLSARGAVEDYFHVAHLTYFTPATLEAVLVSAGFDVVDRDDQRGYAVWQIGRTVARAARRRDPWTARPLDTVEQTRDRLARQRRIEGVDRVFRAVLKPPLRLGQAIVRRVAGNDAAERLRMSARRVWVRSRSRL